MHPHLSLHVGVERAPGNRLAKPAAEPPKPLHPGSGVPEDVPDGKGDTIPGLALGSQLLPPVLR